ncbi:MAG: hypothetical protein R6U54_03505 [Candidatus Omnitrophota bacterium]
MYCLIPSLVIVLALAFGLFLMLRPFLMIRFQQKFYEKINWRIEPVSMPKEIRNTRIMGVSLIVFSLIAGVYLIILGI